MLNLLKGICGTIIAGLGYIFGGFDIMFQVLLFCIIADYMSGLMAALYLGKLNSKVGFKGNVKKIAILLVVALPWKSEGTPALI